MHSNAKRWNEAVGGAEIEAKPEDSVVAVGFAADRAARMHTRVIYLDIKIDRVSFPTMENAPRIRLVLWKAAKAVEMVDRASIEGTGLLLSEFTIMEVLLHKGPLPVNTIGEKVLLTSGSMTAAVKRLENKGFVARIQDSSDGRVFNVHLTDSGREVIEAAFEKHASNLEMIAEVLTAKERNELVRLLKKLGCRAEKLLAG